MNRASPGASRSLRASCSSTSEAARISPSTLRGSSRAAVPAWAVAPAQAGIPDPKCSLAWSFPHAAMR
jgi:hypothetical protein